MLGRIPRQMLVLSVLAWRVGSEWMDVIRRIPEQETARPTLGRTETDSPLRSAGRWGPGPGCPNQFERLWSRLSDSPINFTTIFSLYHLRPESSPLASAWLHHQSLFGGNNILCPLRRPASQSGPQELLAEAGGILSLGWPRCSAAQNSTNAFEQITGATLLRIVITNFDTMKEHCHPL